MVLSTVDPDYRMDEEKDKSPFAKALSDEDLHEKWKAAIAGATTFSWDHPARENDFAKGAITRDRDRRKRDGENREIWRKRHLSRHNAFPPISDFGTQKPAPEMSKLRDQLRFMAIENDCQSRLLASLDMEKVNGKSWLMPVPKDQPPAVFFTDCVPLLESFYSTVSEDSTSIFSPAEEKWLLSVDFNEKPVKVVHPAEREAESETLQLHEIISEECTDTAQPEEEEADAKYDGMFTLLPSTAANIDEKCAKRVQLKEEGAAMKYYALFSQLLSAYSNSDEKRLNAIKPKTEVAAVENDELFAQLLSAGLNIDEKRLNVFKPKKEGADDEIREIFAQLPSARRNIEEKRANVIKPKREEGVAAKYYNLFNRRSSTRSKIGRKLKNVMKSKEEEIAVKNDGLLMILPSTPSNTDEKRINAVVPKNNAAVAQSDDLVASFPSTPSSIDKTRSNAVLATEEVAATPRSQVLPSLPWIPSNVSEISPSEVASTAESGQFSPSLPLTSSEAAVTPKSRKFFPSLPLTSLEAATTPESGQFFPSLPLTSSEPAALPENAKLSLSLPSTPSNIDRKPANAVLPTGVTPPKRRRTVRSNIDVKRSNEILRAEQAAVAEKRKLFPSLPSIPPKIDESSQTKGSAKSEPDNQLRSPLRSPLKLRNRCVDRFSPIGQAAAVENENRDSCCLWNPWKIDENCEKAAPTEAATAAKNNSFPSLQSNAWDIEKLLNEFLPAEGADGGDPFSSLSPTSWNIDEKVFNEILRQEGLISVENDNPGPGLPSAAWNIDEKLNELLPPPEAGAADSSALSPALPAPPRSADELRANSIVPVKSAVSSNNFNITEKSVTIPLPTGGPAILKISSTLLRQEREPSKNPENSLAAAAPRSTAVQIENPSMTYKHSTTVFPSSEHVSGLEILTPDAGGAAIRMPSSDEVEVKIITPQGPVVLSVPKSWNFVTNYANNERQWTFFQVTLNQSNRNTPVIHRSVTIDRDAVIRYFVHGLIVQRCYSRLPRILTDLKAIADILRRFENLHVCVGLGNIAARISRFEGTCRDHMTVYRAKTCWLLLEKRGQCVSCLKLKSPNTNRKRKSTA